MTMGLAQVLEIARYTDPGRARSTIRNAGGLVQR